MAKKKKGKAEKKGRAPRKNSCIAFLRELYTDDPDVSNSDALQALLKEHPESNANVKAIVTWKNMLRAEGLNIPKQRSGRKADKKVEGKKSKSSKGKK